MRLGVIAVQDTMKTEYLERKCEKTRQTFGLVGEQRRCIGGGSGNGHKQQMIGHELRQVVLQHVHMHGRYKVAASTVTTHQDPVTARMTSNACNMPRNS